MNRERIYEYTQVRGTDRGIAGTKLTDGAEFTCSEKISESRLARLVKKVGQKGWCQEVYLVFGFGRDR